VKNLAGPGRRKVAPFIYGVLVERDLLPRGRGVGGGRKRKGRRDGSAPRVDLNPARQNQGFVALHAAGKREKKTRSCTKAGCSMRWKAKGEKEGTRD